MREVSQSFGPKRKKKKKLAALPPTTLATRLKPRLYRNIRPPVVKESHWPEDRRQIGHGLNVAGLNVTGLNVIQPSVRSAV